MGQVCLLTQAHREAASQTARVAETSHGGEEGWRRKRSRREGEEEEQEGGESEEEETAGTEAEEGGLNGH